MTARQTVLARAGWRCERCLSLPIDHVHHRRPKGSGGTSLEWVDAPANLVAAAIRLGTPFKVSTEVSEFRIEVARRIESLNVSRGLRRGAAVSVDDRARIRTQVATEMFTAEFARPPAGPVGAFP